MKTANIYETAELVMAFLEKYKRISINTFNWHANPNTNPNPNHTPDETAASATTEHYSTFVKRLSTKIYQRLILRRSC
jgi:hypothetical protein